jgi:uncharacterized protein (DUF433 family)
VAAAVLYYNRSMDWRAQIEINPKVLAGKPILKGTRIAVEFVLDMVAAGMPENEILQNYPQIQIEGIRACVAYAAEILRAEKVYPLSA